MRTSRSRKIGFLFTSGFLWCLLSPGEGQAVLYSYTDANGVLHVTNVGKEPARAESPIGSAGAQPPAEGVSTKSRAAYEPLIREAAEYYSLPVALVKAIIAAESAFEPAAVSSAGALGLMQLYPQTASAMSVSNSFDPKENIFGGTRYLRLMLNRFQGDIALAAAAYNAGPSAVEKARGIPPFKETRDYVNRVLRLYHIYRDR